MRKDILETASDGFMVGIESAGMMTNRFAKKIRSGEIDTEGQLKSEFKALAKELHPDIAGEGFQAEFVRVRQEYESALGDFDRHRFGASAKDSAHKPKPAKSGSGMLFAELFLLLKRGFPKTARHEKERLRYQYAIWRFRNALAALGSETPSRFDAFHRAILVLRTGNKAGLDTVLRMLYDLVEYKRRPLSPLRTAIEIEYDAIRLSGLLEPDAQAFLGRLVAELGEGNIVR